MTESTRTYLRSVARAAIPAAALVLALWLGIQVAPVALAPTLLAAAAGLVLFLRADWPQRAALMGALGTAVLWAVSPAPAPLPPAAGGLHGFAVAGCAVVSRGADLAADNVFLQILAFAALAGYLAGRRRAGAVPTRRRRAALLAGAAGSAALATLLTESDLRPWVFAAFVGALTLHSLQQRRWLAAVLLVAYDAAAVIHASGRLPSADSRYQFLVLAGILAAAAEGAAAPAAKADCPQPAPAAG
jgi:hypothetical protein